LASPSLSGYCKTPAFSVCAQPIEKVIPPKAWPGHFAELYAMVGSIGDNRQGGWFGYCVSKVTVDYV
jgi:hypothetical protein